MRHLLRMQSQQRYDGVRDPSTAREISALMAQAGPLTAISIYLRTDCRAAGGSSLFPARVSFPHKRHPLIAVATRVGSALRATSKFRQAGPTRLRRRPGSALRQVRGLCLVGSGRVVSGLCLSSGIWHGSDHTLSLVGSDRVFSKFHYMDRPDQTRPTDKVRTCRD